MTHTHTPAPCTGHKQAVPLSRVRVIFRRIIAESALNGIMSNMVGGAILVKLALELGANPLDIGLLGAFPYLSQVVQIPAVLMAGKTGKRRAGAVGGMVIYRLAILSMAIVPLLPDKQAAVSLLLLIVAIRETGGGWTAGPWYGWLRDLMPRRIVGRLFSGRLNLATFAGTIAVVLAGLGVDFVERHRPEWVLPVFSGYMAFAGLCGLASLAIWSTVPDAPMRTMPAREMINQLWEPLGDRLFRRLVLLFLALLFAVNIAVPFFPAYMLQTLNMPTGYVMAFWALGQLIQVPFFSFWQWVAERFSYTTVLATCLPFFVVSLLMWPLTSVANGLPLNLFLLLLIYTAMGIGLAGVLLAAQVMALKLAPPDKMTGYVATTTMLSSVAAGVAATVGGVIAEGLFNTQLNLVITWHSEAAAGSVVAYGINGYKFLFVLAAVLVVLVSPLLAGIQEKGTAPRKVVMRLMQQKAFAMIRGNGSTNPHGWATVFAILGVRRRKHDKPHL